MRPSSVTWIGPRSSFLGQMGKMLFRKKWLSDFKMVKMGTNGPAETAASEGQSRSKNGKT